MLKEFNEALKKLEYDMNKNNKFFDKIFGKRKLSNIETEIAKYMFTSGWNYAQDEILENFTRKENEKEN